MPDIPVQDRGRRGRGAECSLTIRWSGRVKDKVPSSDVGVRAAQLNRYAAGSDVLR